jgi:hypothetical protein
VFVIDAKWYEMRQKVARDGKLGLLASDLKHRAANHQFTEIAQFYTLIADGLIMARHIFEGLERPLFCDNSEDGDKGKLVYTWKPTRDFEWVGGKHGRPESRNAPRGCTFGVIVSKNTKHEDQYPGVDGWINHWSWVAEDNGLAEAPVNWVDRYTRKLWTREL